MADLRQIVFSQTGHFHDGITVNAVLEHVRASLFSGETGQGREQHTGGTLYMLCAVQLWSIAGVDYPQKRG